VDRMEEVICTPASHDGPEMMHELEDGLSVPGEEDFESVAQMKALAFAEKSWTGEMDAASLVTCLREYANTRKGQHGRIFKDPATGKVLGGIQLQLAGDAGDASMPEWMQHELKPGEAYVEYIACHPDATGQGIGSRLLKWADTFAVASGATFITLDVMKKNAGAVKLYERKGYIVQEQQGDVVDKFFQGLAVWTLMGGKYWTVLHMAKQL